QRGTNWGWNLREGFHAYAGAAPPGAQDPLLEEAHTDGWCAIIGGFLYTGSAIPSLDGAYVFGDLCRSALVAVVEGGGLVTDHQDLDVSVPSLVNFGQDGDGEIYAVSHLGTVYKVMPAESSSSSTTSSSSSTTTTVLDTTTTSTTTVADTTTTVPDATTTVPD